MRTVRPGRPVIDTTFAALDPLVPLPSNPPTAAISIQLPTHKISTKMMKSSLELSCACA
jgi:hypothetical protein